MDYDKQAHDFLQKHGLKLEIVRAPHQKCPPFCDDVKHIHGGRYSVELKAAGRAPLVFDFWGSWKDEHPEYYDRKTGKQLRNPEYPVGYSFRRKAPTAYAVLACIAGDSTCPETFCDFCSEYGYDDDSKKAEALFHRCNNFAWKLRRFFTEEELTELQEIQ